MDKMKLLLLLLITLPVVVYGTKPVTVTQLDTRRFDVTTNNATSAAVSATTSASTIKAPKLSLCISNNERRLARRKGVIVVTRTPETNCTEDESEFDSIVRNMTVFPNQQFFRREVWVIPLVVLSGLTLGFVLIFEIFVVCKAIRTNPSRRHLFLGQMLLLGLFLCAGLGIAYAATPTTASCAVVRFGVGVSYALIFGTLMVKCVFLISLNAGVYLPASYQSLLLFFAVVTQVAVSIQWLMTDPPRIKTVFIELGDATTGIPLCSTQFRDFLFALLYVIALLLLVAALALKSRGIRDNYREASYIGLSVGLTVPIWLVWILAGWILQGRHQDACMGFGLVASSAVIFLVMFLPKGRQLAAMGKDGVYGEDESDRFSTSGYSPSFFHWQPLKGGPPNQDYSTRETAYRTLQDRITYITASPYPYPSRMIHYAPYYYPSKGKGLYTKPEEANMYTTLEPTLSTNPNVFFQRGTVGSGVIHPGMMY